MLASMEPYRKGGGVITVITGASSGIGRAVALRLAQSGETVIAIARRQDLLDALVSEIRAAGGVAQAIPCDVTDRDAVAAVVHHILKEYGRIDRLIAAAGGGQKVGADNFQASSIDQMLQLNVIGTANFIEFALPAMLEARSGHLVVISSLAASRGLPGAAGYASAKAALTVMMESLRLDLRGSGIDVTTIHPGFVKTSAKARKRKPLQVELGPAAEIICRAIVQRRANCAFPRSMAIIVGILRVMPVGLYVYLITRLGRRSAAKPTATHTISP